LPSASCSVPPTNHAASTAGACLPALGSGAAMTEKYPTPHPMTMLAQTQHVHSTASDTEVPHLANPPFPARPL
jgi:hypothetical protein